MTEPEKCYCERGYKCPYCENQEIAEEKLKAEKRRVEELLDQ